jgi:hypothetical protein
MIEDRFFARRCRSLVRNRHLPLTSHPVEGCFVVTVQIKRPSLVLTAGIDMAIASRSKSFYSGGVLRAHERRVGKLIRYESSFRVVQIERRAEEGPSTHLGSDRCLCCRSLQTTTRAQPNAIKVGCMNSNTARKINIIQFGIIAANGWVSFSSVRSVSLHFFARLIQSLTSQPQPTIFT